MSDPDVFEIHGVAVRRRNIGGGDMTGEQRCITVRECPTGVVLDGRVSETVMTPDEARHLARSLYRCARRVETRALSEASQ